MLKNALYIVATPIGHVMDLSERAKEVLNQADLIACEDTRVSKKLFSLCGLEYRHNFISYQNYTEQEKAQGIVDAILGGKSVALISDAGSPLISDPGYKLVRLCRENDIDVHAVPGACAVICALQLSGLPTNRFMFAGFIPNKDKARLDLFNELKNIDATLVFYETAVRLVKTLRVLAEVFKTREVAVAREMTKIYEECRTMTAAQLADYYEANPPKGEIVLMVAPPDNNEEHPSIDLKAELRKRLPLMSLKSAVQEVTTLSGAPKNDVYTAALEVKHEHA
jgi:16S rRNA (cytidine1402-2'-O)-methyltransferase